MFAPVQGAVSGETGQDQAVLNELAQNPVE
jgi:hypothetical protein